MQYLAKEMIKTAKYTDVGGRDKNEDRCEIFEADGAVCAVVADGLGGHGGGDVASTMAVDLMGKQFLAAAANQAVEFRVWFEIVNENIYRAQTARCRMRTTLAALWTDGTQYLLAHVGDTRIYHFINGQLSSVTFDHSVAQMAVFRGEITQQQIRGHIDRNRLLRALGTEGKVKVEVSGPDDLTEGRHAFLLCTDGFWEYVLESEMEKALQKAVTPEQWIGMMRMRLRSCAEDNRDNNTAVAVWIDTE